MSLMTIIFRAEGSTYKKAGNLTTNFSDLMIKILITYLAFLKRSTSRAITSSSSVGITNTFTFA